MNRLIRTELLKTRTMRTTYGLLATAAALTILFSSLEAGRAGKGTSGVAPLSTASGLDTVTTVTGFSMLPATVFGVILASGEFRHAGATLTYLATPARSRVPAAKTVAAAAIGLLFGLVAGVIATCVGLAFAAGRGDGVGLGAGPLIGHVAGAACGAALLAALGPAHDVAGPGPLPFVATAIMPACLTAVLALIASRTTIRRDVT